MDIMNVWTAVEHMWVASGAAELAIFTAILYWFFTSSRVADMLEVVGEKVGGWCGRENSGSLRQAVRTRHRHHQASVHAKLESDAVTRASSLYRVKEGPTVPAPKPIVRPSTGLACLRCAPVSRESWHDTKSPDTDTVINVLDIGRQRFANGGVVSRYLCDLAQCLNLVSYDYKDFVPEVLKDEHFQQAIEEQAQDELKKLQEENQKKGSGDEQSGQYQAVRSRVEKKAYSILVSISSAMSNSVLRLAAWIVHKAIRRVAGGVCGTRSACIERLRRAKAAGLPLVFVPLHRSHFDYILVSFVLYISGLRPPLVAAGDNMRIPFFGWLLRGCGAFYIRRRTEGSDNHTDPLYKAALRSYILNSLSQNNNLEFFIEGGRTRTGKPGLPKAGILSVILDAYLDGTIDDALLVPVTMNYDRLVDGNFVREQLGMPKQMETFWSALRGIWSTLCTNHGGIRVDFNQPISLKELVTSFQNYSYLKCPVERTPAPPNNNLSVNLDRQILYNHSHSSLYGSQVGADHKMMVEAIGRHLVYDASQSTAMMCTNVMAYVLLTTAREGCTFAQLRQLVATRGDALRMEGRDLGYMGDPTKRALDTLSRGLVRRSGSGDTQVVAPVLSVAASLELSYYANSLVAHYASTAIVATALESLICEPDADPNEVRHTRLIESALQLYEILSHELIICPPCKRSEDEMLDALGALLAADVITAVQPDTGLEEQRWSRRLAARMEEDGEIEPSSENVVRYRVNRTAEAIRERRRLVLTLRPLLEAYAATCRVLTEGPQRALVTQAMDSLVQAYTQDRMRYGEAISVDAIRNCHSLLRQWGLIDIYTENRQRHIRFLPPYDNRTNLDQVCANLYRFNMDTPLLQST